MVFKVSFGFKFGTTLRATKVIFCLVKKQMPRKIGFIAEPLGAAYLKVGEVRDGVPGWTVTSRVGAGAG